MLFPLGQSDEALFTPCNCLTSSDDHEVLFHDAHADVVMLGATMDRVPPFSLSELAYRDEALLCGRWFVVPSGGPFSIPRVSFHSLRATLSGSMPACFHHTHSLRERCSAR